MSKKQSLCTITDIQPYRYFIAKCIIVNTFSYLNNLIGISRVNPLICYKIYIFNLHFTKHLLLKLYTLFSNEAEMCYHSSYSQKILILRRWLQFFQLKAFKLDKNFHHFLCFHDYHFKSYVQMIFIHKTISLIT